MDPTELNNFLTYMQQDYETALLKARQEYEAELLQSQHLRQQGVVTQGIDKLQLQNYEAALNIIIEVHSPDRIIAQNAKACALTASHMRKN